MNEIERPLNAEEQRKMDEFNNRLGALCAEMDVEFMVGSVDFGTFIGTTIATRKPIYMKDIIHACTEIVKDARVFLQELNSAQEGLSNEEVPAGTILQ